MDEYLTEKEQWERVLGWLRTQGPWVLAGIAIAGLALGGWRLWQAHTRNYDLAAEARYEQLLATLGQNHPDRALKLAGQLIRQYPNTAYADQARLEVARIQVVENRLPQAAAELLQVMSSTRDPELALVARLRLARVQLSEHKPDLALATLSGATPGAFGPRFDEVRGDALLAKGDRAGALKQYQAALAGGDATIDTGLLHLKIRSLGSS